MPRRRNPNESQRAIVAARVATLAMASAKSANLPTCILAGMDDLLDALHALRPL